MCLFNFVASPFISLKITIMMLEEAVVSYITNRSFKMGDFNQNFQKVQVNLIDQSFLFRIIPGKDA